jgi:high-affinity K+ transport system ATPase subunit B
MPGVTERELADAAAAGLAGRRDARGPSIVVLAKQRSTHCANAPAGRSFVPFTAQTRMSGLDAGGEGAAQGRGRRGCGRTCWAAIPAALPPESRRTSQQARSPAARRWW